MATCKTCGRTIAVPKGWSVGPAVRKHYWDQHPERMEKTRLTGAQRQPCHHPKGLPMVVEAKAPGRGRNQR